MKNYEDKEMNNAPKEKDEQLKRHTLEMHLNKLEKHARFVERAVAMAHLCGRGGKCTTHELKSRNSIAKTILLAVLSKMQ